MSTSTLKSGCRNMRQRNDPLKAAKEAPKLIGACRLVCTRMTGVMSGLGGRCEGSKDTVETVIATEVGCPRPKSSMTAM